MTETRSPDLREQAISWQLRLNDNPHDSDVRRQFEEWRAASPQHQQAWDRAERVRAFARLTIESERRASRANAASIPFSRELRRDRPSGLFGRYFGVSLTGGLAVACAALMILVPDLSDWWRADYSTGTAVNRTIALADGSEVVLGARSAVALSHDPALRGVTLLHGEAYFRVVHNERHPFVVKVASFAVKDIGTAFNVRQAGGHLAVAVREGRVSVRETGSHRDAATELGAGEQLDVDLENPQSSNVTQVSPDTVGSWQTGILSVEGIPMGDLVSIIRRYYPGYVMISGPMSARTEIGGVYDLNHPLDALKMLVSARHGDVNEYGGHVAMVRFTRASSDEGS
ncbi:hypothetical protein AD948_02780 [Acetobacter senegalensis]|uniref:DUF4880 domain-containing protein n=1 Tax=Acetobacter senegalensis TaxID=446692 RepID=A0A149U6L4_9PROT|nr:FecR domain-containing protein [Acetobacter senegalensis]KXV61144.1 hypothetical protein AD948_02780 [Acetobacter senegalensis]